MATTSSANPNLVRYSWKAGELFLKIYAILLMLVNTSKTSKKA
jgi:hypothetical protein